MTDAPRIAVLPMYDFPELRVAHDAFWSALAGRLIASGIADVPRHLTRDLGHRDAWGHPSLLFGQACEYPIAKSFGDRLTLVATPRYSAPGCEENFHRSAIVVRAQDAADTLAGLRGRRCVVNEPDSNSGMNLLRATVAPLAGGTGFFQSVCVSGSHRRSIELIAADEADVAGVDCVSLAYLQRLYPALASRVRILCWSPPSPSLPFVTSCLTDQRTLEALRASLASVLADSAMNSVRESLFLEGVDLRPDATLSRPQQLEREAIELQYPVLW
jgi:ABC-type phosphate/phosphonate transport system substrate-binding protein